MWCQTILDHVDGGVIRVKDGLVTSWNKGAEKIYKYSEEEMLGKEVDLIVCPEWKEQLHDCLLQIPFEDVPSWEMKHIGKTGKLIYAWVTLVPNFNSKKDLESIIFVIKDITKQKIISEKMQRLEELNMIGQLAASLSHEISYPMSAVEGFLLTLSEKNELCRYTDILDMMISEIGRVDSMMSEFLAFGRLNGGGRPLCNLNKVVRGVLPLLQAHAGELNRVVSVELTEVPEIELNEKEIRQIILNLVRNSLETVPEGGMVALRTSYEGGKVVLAIQDQGEGVPAHILEQLGAPFMTTKAKGTGLGLSVCLHIIAKHCGEVDVQTCDNGTTFYVKFPCEF
ncbi:ATP-binding protein [Desulfitobacterium sp. THU1]|uniref:two-component system sensor histidine kinase NtrB n=1 Tax=Desulfitobacterium sp. THU1 TaxID=3138072 RepID=UPI00311E778E